LALALAAAFTAWPSFGGEAKMLIELAGVFSLSLAAKQRPERGEKGF